jgi:hypothetical protein
MHRIALLAAILVLCLVPTGVAQAQFGAPNAPEQLTKPPPPPPPEADKFDDGGLSTLQIVLIFGGATLVLALIGFVIVRDARRRAPVDEKPRRDGSGSAKARAGGGGPAHNSSMAEIRARERQQAKRAKSKAKNVRQQRKKNRPR